MRLLAKSQVHIFHLRTTSLEVNIPLQSFVGIGNQSSISVQDIFGEFVVSLFLVFCISSLQGSWQFFSFCFVSMHIYLFAEYGANLSIILGNPITIHKQCNAKINSKPIQY